MVVVLQAVAVVVGGAEEVGAVVELDEDVISGQMVQSS